jgi:hypothetical protein
MMPRAAPRPAAIRKLGCKIQTERDGKQWEKVKGKRKAEAEFC